MYPCRNVYFTGGEKKIISKRLHSVDSTYNCGVIYSMFSLFSLKKNLFLAFKPFSATLLGEIKAHIPSAADGNTVQQSKAATY